eukprot:558446-Amorphochlora_amoeboformis.AAC.1
MKKSNRRPEPRLASATGPYLAGICKEYRIRTESQGFKAFLRPRGDLSISTKSPSPSLPGECDTPPRRSARHGTRAFPLFPPVLGSLPHTRKAFASSEGPVQPQAKRPKQENGGLSFVVSSSGRRKAATPIASASKGASWKGDGRASSWGGL